MKIETSDYYKKKGVKDVYVVTNTENRKVAVLVYENKEKHSMSYAKYVYTSFYEYDIAKGDQIDHINNDKTDDSIENLQVLSPKSNSSKRGIYKTFVELQCPVCKEYFIFPKRNLSTHKNPCCSRKCGGIKSHWKKHDL